MNSTLGSVVPLAMFEENLTHLLFEENLTHLVFEESKENSSVGDKAETDNDAVEHDEHILSGDRQSEIGFHLLWGETSSLTLFSILLWFWPVSLAKELCLLRHVLLYLSPAEQPFFCFCTHRNVTIWKHLIYFAYLCSWTVEILQHIILIGVIVTFYKCSFTQASQQSTRPTPA